MQPLLIITVSLNQDDEREAYLRLGGGGGNLSCELFVEAYKAVT